MNFDIAVASTANQAGILRGFYAAYDEFITIESPATAFDNIISVAHTPLADAGGDIYGFREISFTQEKSEFEIEGVGDMDGMASKKTAKLWVPGDDRRVAKFCTMAGRFLFLIERTPCNGSSYYQLGSACTPARVLGWKFMTKKIGDSESKGWEIQVGCIEPIPLYYSAAIPMAADV